MSTEGKMYVRATVLIGVTIRGTPNPEGIARLKADMRRTLESSGAVVESLEAPANPRRLNPLAGAKGTDEKEGVGGTMSKLDEAAADLDRISRDRRKLGS